MQVHGRIRATNKKIDKLKIETDKEKYNIGDTAKVTFEGTKRGKGSCYC